LQGQDSRAQTLDYHHIIDNIEANYRPLRNASEIQRVARFILRPRRISSTVYLRMEAFNLHWLTRSRSKFRNWSEICSVIQGLL